MSDLNPRGCVPCRPQSRVFEQVLGRAEVALCGPLAVLRTACLSAPRVHGSALWLSGAGWAMGRGGHEPGLVRRCA